MNERDDQERSDHAEARHLYGRRAYDHGPTEAPEARRPDDKGPDGGNGHDGTSPSPPEGKQTDQNRDGKPETPDKPNERDAADKQNKPDAQDEQGKPSPESHPKAPAIKAGLPRRLAMIAGVVLVLAAIVAALLFWRHHHRLRAEADRRAHEIDRGPRVFVTSVRTEPAARDLTLPADVRGFSQTTVYAKVSGYVKSIEVDKGDAVRPGQLLGVLESPEVDQQVAAAAADVVVKRRTFDRYKQLVEKDFVSQQDFETARAAYEVAEATLKQNRAMQDYERLRAPFAGTVTARYVDPGALVPAATGSTQSALPLVDIADLSRLRILVFVQQDATPFIHVGDSATLTIDQQPNVKITAPISRVAQSLDPRSRTMLCEIWLDNAQRLYPGTFVHVTLHLRTSAFPLVPTSALLTHENKPAVAVIREGRVHFVPVKPGLDDGHNVQIKQGLKGGERIALDLPAEIAEGAQVQPTEKKQDDKGEGEGKGPQGKASGGNEASGKETDGKDSDGGTASGDGKEK